MENKSIINRIRVKILAIGKPEMSGRIYSKEIAEEIIKTINSEGKPIFGGMTSYDGSLNDVSYVVQNAEIVDDSIVADIEILDTPRGNLLNEVINNDVVGDVVFKPFGYGKVDDKNRVYGYTINWVIANIEDKEKDKGI